MVITSLQLVQMIIGCVVNYMAFNYKQNGQFYDRNKMQQSSDLFLSCQDSSAVWATPTWSCLSSCTAATSCCSPGSSTTPTWTSVNGNNSPTDSKMRTRKLSWKNPMRPKKLTKLFAFIKQLLVAVNPVNQTPCLPRLLFEKKNFSVWPTGDWRDFTLQILKNASAAGSS